MKPWSNLAVQETSSFASIPAPVGGINRRDSFAGMPPTDAVAMRNWYPTPSSVVVRRGWVTHAVGFAAPVETVIVYTNRAGVQEILAFAGTNLFRCTAPSTAPTIVVSGLSNAYWQHVQFANDAGTFLYCVNGTDPPIVYDGTTFMRVNAPNASGFTNGFSNGFGGTTPFNISGADPLTFINITAHQRRLWFVQKDSSTVFYLPVDQVGGTVAPFPLGQLFGLGGYVMAQMSWSLDNGAGLDDHILMVSSQGEVAIYFGDNPDDATTWGLQGVYVVGTPVGRRCFSKMAGDVAYICQDGLVPFSKYLQSTTVDRTQALTDKIQQLISQLITVFGGNKGWVVTLFTRENQLWLNVPGTQLSVQYSMSLITGAWAEFLGMDALDFALYKDQPIFGTRDGRVCRAWEGFLDGANYSISYRGEPIDTNVITAFNYFGNPGQPKRWTMARPIFQAGGIPATAIGLNIDFNITDDLLPPIGALQRVVAIWDFDRWDHAVWSSELRRYQNWQSVAGVGFCAALHMKMAQTSQTAWLATDFKFENGHGI